MRSSLMIDAQLHGDIRRVSGGMAIRLGQDSPINFVVEMGLDRSVSADDGQGNEGFFLRASTRHLFRLTPWADHDM